jgi:hypothetical protein
MTNSAGEVVIIDPLTRHDWNDLLLSCAGSTIFHTANWARVLAHSYDFTPRYFTLFKGGVFKGCIPVMDVNTLLTERRGVSLSFSDYCSSLVGEPGDFQELLNTLLAYGRKCGWKFAEFRGENFLADHRPSQTFVHHELLLCPDEELMFSRLRKSTADNVKKAIREGVQVEFTDSLQGVREYYALHCLTRKHHGLPPQPLRFFKELHDHVIAQGLGFTALARHGGQVVAGVICLHFGRHAMFKYSAYDKRYQHLRPTNLVFWESIKRCAKEGCDSFSMGRTDPGNEGLLCFKNGWGANRSVINYHRYDFLLDAFAYHPSPDRSRYRKIFMRLPLRVLTMIGDLIYKYQG